jgi:hypothetical protein
VPTIREKQESNLLAYVAKDLQHHLHFMQVLLAGLSPTVLAFSSDLPKFGEVALGVLVLDKDDVVADASQIRTPLRAFRVQEFGIHECTDQRGDLRPHSVLLLERSVRIAFEHESLEERAVEIVAVAFLHGELVVIDFRSQLSRAVESANWRNHGG